MKQRVFLLITAVILSLLSPAGALAIIGGALDENRHPYVGALDLTPTGRRIPCTGTLISPTVFLTAGHCTRFLDEAGLAEAQVTFDPDFNNPSATFYTGVAYTNPAFTQRQNDPGDFGVVVFPEPIPGIEPASLPTAFSLDEIGHKALKTRSFPTVGYGITRLIIGDGGTRPDRNSAGTRKVAIQTFHSLTKEWLFLDMLDDGQACTGDSGAPNFWGDTNLVVAIGIAGNCSALDKTLRLDTPSAREFLGAFVDLP